MAWMMSAPAPDWIAEVMRACRSLPLMVSNVILSPSAFSACGSNSWRSSVSEAGTKSPSRSQCSVVLWA